MYLIIKRIIDILASLLLGIFLLPFFVIIALLLKLTGEGEIFYLQERIGYKNEPFYIWKFATMLKNSTDIGTGDITIRNDPRLLPLGKFLRRTKLNELPQLINVLQGNMSLVGPRPLMKTGVNRYPQQIQLKIYLIKPGVTGVGSIIFRDEEKIITRSNDYELTAKIIFAQKGELELWYQRNLSFLTDLKILFLTVWVIAFPKSILPSRLLKGLPEPLKDTTTFFASFN